MCTLALQQYWPECSQPSRLISGGCRLLIHTRHACTCGVVVFQGRLCAGPLSQLFSAVSRQPCRSLPSAVQMGHMGQTNTCLPLWMDRP